MKRNFVIFSLTSLFFMGSLNAQDDPGFADLCNEEYVTFLVSQQVSEGRSVREKDKRIRILMRSADFIWPYDEASGRQYFAEAFKTAVEHFGEKGIEERSTTRGLSIPGPDFRFEVVRSIAKRDAVWARKLADEIFAEFEKAAKDRNERDQTSDVALMLTMAVENASDSPELSWYLFRRVMRYPLDFHWYHCLISLARQNPSTAAALYRELLQNYRNETPRRLLFLSAYPFAAVRIFGIDKYQFGGIVPDTFVPDPELQRQFLEVFFDRIALISADPEERMRPPDQHRQPEAVYMVSALNDIEPHVLNTLPFLMSRFSTARAQANSLLTEEMRNQLAQRERQTANLGLSFDERLASMEEADKEGRLNDQMILNLVTWGNKTEEQFRKLEPWLDKIKDDETRPAATSYFWFLRSKLAIKESRFADAEKHASRVPELEHRTILAFDIAEAQLKSINDASSAYQTLNEVAKQVRKIENSPTKAKMLLGLANQYEKLNPGFAMEELAEAVRVINRLEGPDLSTTQTYRQIQGKGWAFFAVFSIPGYDLENTFKKMGETDFGLTLSNAKAIEDRFLRTIAVLAAARNCVDTGSDRSAAEAEN